MTLAGEPRYLEGPALAGDVDRVLELLADADRARAEAAALLGTLGGAELERFLGYASWERLVAHRSGCGNRAASELVRIARHVARFGLTGAALAAGVIGWAQAEVLARAAAGLADAYERDEAELLSAAERCEIEELERLCRLWRDRSDAEAAAEDAERRFDQRGLWLQMAFDGSCRGRLQLDAVGAEIVAQALETNPDPAAGLAPPRSLAQRRADELVEICAATLDVEGTETASDAGGFRTRARVDVVIDVETLAGVDGSIERLRAELDHGGPITGPGLDRLLCDASFRALVQDGPNVVLAYNRATPDIPPSLRRAVRLRDHTCVFHGCDRHWRFCDLHHLVPRNRGGPTTIENLAVVCRFHHGLVHEGGWQLTRAPDGTVETRSP